MVSILLLCDDDHLGRRVLRCIDPRDNSVHVLSESSRDPIRYSRFISSHTRFTFPVDDGIDSAVADLNRLIERHRADVVVPVDIRAEKFLTRARSSIQNAHVFPVSDVETIDCLNDKWRFAQLVERHGIPAPATRLITSADDVRGFDLNFPVVVKPLRQRFSRGLKTLSSRDALFDHIRSIAVAPGASKLPLIAQEYVPGEDMGCSILASDGRIVAWTAQVSYPTRGGCVFSRNSQCFDIAERIADACGFSGIANFDLRRDSRSGRVVVLECNPRIWLSIHASKVWGVDFVALGIDLAQGKDMGGCTSGHVAEGEPYLHPAQVVRDALGGRMPFRDFRSHLRRVWGPLSDPLPAIVTRLMLGLFLAF